MAYQRRYTFPFVSHSSSYVENLGDQFWVFENAGDRAAENGGQRERQNAYNHHPRRNSNYRPKKERQTVGFLEEKKKRRLCPCDKLKTFKTHNVDPVIRDIQNYIGYKSHVTTEKIIVMKDVFQSEEFREVKSKFRKCNNDGNGRTRRGECPGPFRRLRKATQDTVLLYKIRKSELLLR